MEFKTKQEAIKHAYGDFYEAIKNNINENGWFDYYQLGISGAGAEKFMTELECEYLKSDFKVRPILLKGIEFFNDTEVLKSAIEKWGVVPQVEMLNEEATELALAARKWLRKGNKKEFENLAEEIADVEILIAQMELIYPDIRERISYYRVFKMQRLERRVNGDNFEGE